MSEELYLKKQFELEIQRLGINGEGVGHWNGYTIFVEQALPGEKVLVSLYEKRKNFGRAKVIKYLSLSPSRVQPPCPLFGKCGGCQIMHLEYKEQLSFKRQRVIDNLERIGKLHGIEVNPSIASPYSLNYRNKIQLPAVQRNSTLRLGLYAQHTHDIIEIERCTIHNSLGEEAYQYIKEILKNFSIRAYDPELNEGEIRHILIRSAVFTKQVLVVFITSDQAASTSFQAIADLLIKKMPEIKGVIQNINKSKNNTILGSEFQILAGIGHIEEKLLGLVFKISPASFFQVNSFQAENLYQLVIDMASLKGEETVLDAYCGVGTLSLLLSCYAKRVVGVECVPEAIFDAQENALKNGISNAVFKCDVAEEFIKTLSPSSIDVAILNPPRKGCELSFLERLAILRPKRIVYVSCDPATLARDLAFLHKQGWQIEVVQPVDMFPQTAHVETVVKLSLI